MFFKKNLQTLADGLHHSFLSVRFHYSLIVFISDNYEIQVLLLIENGMKTSESYNITTVNACFDWMYGIQNL